jgi:hypothetical protein
MIPLHDGPQLKKRTNSTGTGTFDQIIFFKVLLCPCINPHSYSYENIIMPRFLYLSTPHTDDGMRDMIPVKPSSPLHM